jgi:hypothetical protein
MLPSIRAEALEAAAALWTRMRLPGPAAGRRAST